MIYLVVPTTNYFIDHSIDYLQNKSFQSFGELEENIGSNIHEEVLIDQLKRICDRDSHFLLAGKLFSQVISKKMVKFNKELMDEFRFQQKFLTVFKHLYEGIRSKGKNQNDSEIQTAKILWNLIEENRFENISLAIIKDKDIEANLARDKELIEKFQVNKNLVRIVQRRVFTKDDSSSVYQKASNLVNRAIDLYKNEKFKEMSVVLELALRKIQEFEGKEGAAIFATLVGTLLVQKTKNVSKGLYFLKRGEMLYEELSNKTMYTENLSKLASAFWSLGMYKRALDKLSTEIYLHTLQKNDLSIMFSQAKLCHFFYNLSRFIESQEWALNFINSSIRSSNEKLKAIYFLNANIDYGRTLIGLNAWHKAEAHLDYAQRALKHIEIFDEKFIKEKSLEINCMKGIIATARGQYSIAKDYFALRKKIQTELSPTSAIYARFLRAEANLYRNERKFAQGIKIIQPLFQAKETVNPKNVALLAEILALYNHEKEALKLLERTIKVLSEWNSIHGLSNTYLTKGYIYLLLENFGESKKWYTQSLEITGTDLVDLKISIDAHINLAYMALEEDNLKIAERHFVIAEECASMSGSLAFLLDSQILKAYLTHKQGKKTTAKNILHRVELKAKDLEINYIFQKTNFILNQF